MGLCTEHSQTGEERASLLTQPARSYYYNDIHFEMTLLLLRGGGGGIHKQAVRPARNKSELLSGGYLCFSPPGQETHYQAKVLFLPENRHC